MESFIIWNALPLALIELGKRVYCIAAATPAELNDTPSGGERLSVCRVDFVAAVSWAGRWCHCQWIIRNKYRDMLLAVAVGVAAGDLQCHSLFSSC